MKTIHDVMRIAQQQYQISRSELRMLIAKVMNIDDSLTVPLIAQQNITPEQENTLMSYIAEHNRGTPIHYIVGQKEFWSMNFIVTPAVLIPRQDSETIIEQLLKTLHIFNKIDNKIRILDLGTGSGCLLISAIKELRKRNFDATGIGIDISTKSLDIATINARRHNVDNFTQFLQSNWFERLDASQEIFDVILANPPYLSSSEWQQYKHVNHAEPQSALTDFHDGLTHYRTILSEISRFIPQDSPSLVLVEFGWKQGNAVTEIAKSSLSNNILSNNNMHFNYTIIQDIENRDRVLRIVIE